MGVGEGRRGGVFNRSSIILAGARGGREMRVRAGGKGVAKTKVGALVKLGEWEEEDVTRVGGGCNQRCNNV